MDGVSGLLGLAARARRLVWGTERVREAVRAGDVRFAIVAGDASANTKKRLVPLLEASGVPYVERFDRESLGKSIGKAPVSAVGVTGRDLAARIRVLAGSGSSPGD